MSEALTSRGPRSKTSSYASPKEIALLYLKTAPIHTPADMTDLPVSQTLCSKHLSSSFQVSKYSSGPQGRHTLSEVVVHLEDMYFPSIRKKKCTNEKYPPK